MLTCCVKGCGKQDDKTTDRSFHSFPLQDQELLQKWIEALGSTKLKETPAELDVICSAHFDNSDLIQTEHAVVLREGCVPKIRSNTNVKNASTEKKQNRHVFMLKRSAKPILKKTLSKLLTQSTETTITCMYRQLHREIRLYKRINVQLKDTQAKIRKLNEVLYTLTDVSKKREEPKINNSVELPSSSVTEKIPTCVETLPTQNQSEESASTIKQENPIGVMNNMDQLSPNSTLIKMQFKDEDIEMPLINSLKSEPDPLL